jgi:hypothetical protein
MQATPFDPETDMAPLPFHAHLLALALEMKRAGLKWTPHVGCFVWDHKEVIEVPSPFPNRVYFILNLSRFLSIFKDIDNMIAKLVWVPTWHQARMLAQQLGVAGKTIDSLWSSSILAPGDELAQLYRLLINTLNDYKAP